MPPEGARLAWITRERCNEFYGDASDLYREGVKPVKRRRCVPHDCEVRDDSDECWRAEGWIVVGSCHFVTEYAVPAPEEAP
jgi:hypothetical protein